jgi:hypothetical protein
VRKRERKKHFALLGRDPTYNPCKEGIRISRLITLLPSAAQGGPPEQVDAHDGKHLQQQQQQPQQQHQQSMLTESRAEYSSANTAGSQSWSYSSMTSRKLNALIHAYRNLNSAEGFVNEEEFNEVIKQLWEMPFGQPSRPTGTTSNFWLRTTSSRRTRVSASSSVPQRHAAPRSGR